MFCIGKVPNCGRIFISNQPHGLKVETVDEKVRSLPSLLWVARPEHNALQVSIEDFAGDAESCQEL